MARELGSEGIKRFETPSRRLWRDQHKYCGNFVKGRHKVGKTKADGILCCLADVRG